MNHRYQLTLICIMMILYALCYQIQSPLQPFLVQKLVKQAHTNATLSQQQSSLNNISQNSSKLTQTQQTTIQQKIQINSAQTYAKMRSLFSIAQCFCSLVFGLILDRWGVKKGLMINFIACALCYYLLSISTTVELLYLSKIPGIAMAGYLCAQAAVVKLTDPGLQRIRWLGFITTGYTIGGTIGPYLGGKLGSSGDYYTSAFYATIGSIFCLFLTFLLPSSSELEKNDTNNTQSQVVIQVKQKSKNFFQTIIYLISLCWFFIAIKLATCIVNSMARSSQPLILKGFGVNQETMGKILSAQFAFGGLTNAFLLTPLTDLFGGKSEKVIDKCLFLMAFFYFIWFCFFSETINLIQGYQQYRVYVILVIVLFLAIFQYTLAVSNTNKTSSMVPRGYQGTYLGLQNTIFAVGFMIGPQVGVKIWPNYGIGGLTFTCLSLLFLCFLSAVLYFNIKTKQKQTVKEKTN